METDYAPPQHVIDEWKKHCQCCPHPCDGADADPSGLTPCPADAVPMRLVVKRNLITREVIMETETIDKLFLELSQFTKAKSAKELVMEDALLRLAKLGNEPHFGNSIGNDIAKAALDKVCAMDANKFV